MVGKAGGEQSGEELGLSGERFGGYWICGKSLAFSAQGRSGQDLCWKAGAGAEEGEDVCV